MISRRRPKISASAIDLLRRLRDDAREILRHALQECSPERILPSRLQWTGKLLEGPGIRFDLAGKAPLVLSYGKASASMARALACLLPEVVSEGIIVVPEGTRPSRIAGFLWMPASHPVPDTKSFRAGRLVLERVGRAGREDRIIHLISGGGSALLAAPLRPLVSAREKIGVHRLLVESGLGIREVNIVRKRFSAIKGGRLLQASTARQLSLILSDVPEGAPELVAGGPTLPDTSSQEECRRILQESGILAALPVRLQLRIRSRGFPELPRPGDPRFLTHSWTVVASCADLVEAASSRARRLGYRVRVLPEPIECPVEQALDRIMAARDRLRESTEGPLCVVGGGEVRVRVGIRKGRGGRAQELAAAAGERLEGFPGRVFLASGSDGVDGNSPAAGAVSDGTTLERARRKGLDTESLRRSGNTYRLFQSLGDSLETGPTENNLRDLYLLLEAPGTGGSLNKRVATGDRRGSSGKGRC